VPHGRGGASVHTASRRDLASHAALAAASQFAEETEKTRHAEYALRRSIDFKGKWGNYSGSNADID
jgi:hypothetical protein